MIKHFVRSKRGFTLIELLVVITLIAILAVAVLAAINPVEQRRKAIDTGMKATAAELVSAEERFFANFGCYTHNWNTTTNVCNAVAVQATAAVTTAGLNLGQLLTAGEVKQSFITKIGTAPYSGLQYTVDADQVIHVSFVPTSRAFVSTWNAGCTAQGGAGSTSFCVPDTVQ